MALLGGGTARGQGDGGEQKRVTTIRGRVLNRVTQEPVGRALVTAAGDEYATMTDERGQFELKMKGSQRKATKGNVAGSQMPMRLRTKGGLQARKPGFLPLKRPALASAVKEGREEATIYLTPEALIVGRVAAPGWAGERILCEFFRLVTIDGRERWSSAGNFPAWANGEFRFSGLEAGTYRLITHEGMDRDSLALGPGAQMFGYPPVYYPNTTDFSAAAPIVVKAGETAQANLTLARREYFPVRIPVANAAASESQILSVFPSGHWGPGWSLNYNPEEQVIEGRLPDGNYTVELNTYGGEPLTGVVNFTVDGRAAQGPPMNLVPNVTVSVNVREEFQTSRTAALEKGAFIDPKNRAPEQQKAQVILAPMEELKAMESRMVSEPVEGTQGQTLRIRNVRPGTYRVIVTPFSGYAAVVESGGTDLLRQPLAVGRGGGAPPIEVTLRDDGAEVSGVVEGSPAGQGNSGPDATNPEHYWTLLLVPVGRGVSEPLWFRTHDGNFILVSLAPGDYLVAAYDETPGDVAFGEEEFMKALEEKAQKFHVEAGEKVTNLRVKAIAAGEGE